MPAQRLRLGDKVVVVGIPPITFPPGFRDTIGTKKLFKHMLGRTYTVKGFDQNGHVELTPKRLQTVWIEPEFLRLRGPREKRKAAPRQSSRKQR